MLMFCGDFERELYLFLALLYERDMSGVFSPVCLTDKFQANWQAVAK